MKAVVYEKYGGPDVLEIRDLPTPAPADDEILIRTVATTVTAGDCRVRSLRMPSGFGLIARAALGVSKPRQPILGSELAGKVESVGRNVRKFKAGDEVFAFTGARLGCHAEYKCLRERDGVVHKPTTLTFEEAAALSSGGTTALAFFRKGNLQRGEKVLVNGASGSVGAAAVQLAKHFGANVTGVCGTANKDFVTSLGADHVIDYTKQDFTTNGEPYDVIVDTAGTAPFSRSKSSLSENGRLLLVLSGLADVVQIPWIAMTGTKRVVAGPAAWNVGDLQLLAELATAGKFRTFIDRSYPLEQIAEAHRYVDTGRKRGNVVITV